MATISTKAARTDPSAAENQDTSQSARKGAVKPLRRTQADRRSASKSGLLRAAYELVAERGFRATSFQAIAERAGYSASLVSARFGSREGLLAELVRRMVQRWTATVRNPTVDSKVGVEGLIATAKAHREALEKAPAAVRAMYMLIFESLLEAPDLRREIAEFDLRLRTGTEQLLAKGVEQSEEVDVHAQATLFLAILRGITLQWMLNPEAIELERLYRALEKLLEKGLR